MFRRILAASSFAVAAIGCGSGIREVEVSAAPSPLKVVADSTATLVSIAAHETDSAMVKARVAVVARSLEDSRELVTSARSSVVTAGSHVAIAMRQGDWLRNVVADGARGGEYARYWSIGRLKLDEARAQTASAVAAADQVLACQEQQCLSERARLMQQHVEAAAGLAREAESVVRVAMVQLQ